MILCFQADYTKYKRQLMEMIEKNGHKFVEYNESKETLQEMIDLKEEPLQEIVTKGKMLCQKIEGASYSLLKDELNKELDVIKKERQNIKKDILIISRICNIKYINSCEDAQYIVY